ncbi:maleylpyruvate isomerase family mycothiol-dependent enzyme [Nocardia gipuzkoensis]|uniref:maleylpyruvate isomerase family mycothiol-dependent enzyme n=1 Tax=Nocardia gipuzkoensis TaxID=2749991 RepID=UPI001E614978|nr:maleylpyruvate isomerase family mycothiol-dependent enzyme [Nocardia gipuzkoensis]UGT69416.1 maleylpyruvate isomerase family mycothiol-dependent enzyme [Nocardia gipuzkoensis]
MDLDKIMMWTRAERLGVADFLDDLDDHEWAADSLCPGWTVHDVSAHLTLSNRVTLGATIAGVVRARGDWNRMTERMARDRASRYTPAELIAQLREGAGWSRRAPGAGPLDPLVDTMIHGQDIARPLGRRRDMPAEQAVVALEHVLRSPFYGSKKRLRGVRVVATDAEWSAGSGPEEIHGPLSDLLLLATGRAAGLAGVTGTGVQRLAQAL